MVFIRKEYIMGKFIITEEDKKHITDLYEEVAVLDSDKYFSDLTSKVKTGACKTAKQIEGPRIKINCNDGTYYRIERFR